MLINYLLIILNGFVTGIVFIFLLRKFSVRYRVLITQEIPLIGGIAMGLSFIIACLVGFSLFRSLSQEVRAIIISSFIMLAFGVVDDWKELSILAKFSVQIIATALLIFFGVRTQIIHIGNLANIIITFVWVLGISNAFNHLDVMDGAAAGTALIVSLAFFAIGALNGDIENTILTLALSSAITGFLIYNKPPAKIYMGNSGSHFLGFILAAIALAISYAPLERKVALFSPLLILGFPIFDTAFLIFIRLKNGRSALKKSNDHLVLRLLKLGFSKKRALLFTVAVASFFSFCGVLISQVSNTFGTAILICVALVSLGLTRKMSRVSI